MSKILFRFLENLCTTRVPWDFVPGLVLENLLRTSKSLNIFPGIRLKGCLYSSRIKCEIIYRNWGQIFGDRITQSQSSGRWSDEVPTHKNKTFLYFLSSQYRERKNVLNFIKYFCTYNIFCLFITCNQGFFSFVNRRVDTLFVCFK